MYQSIEIKNVYGLQVLDSRGIPTVQATVVLGDGSVGKASVPSGASTGQYEAHEKRDGANEFSGKSVNVAIQSINTEIKTALLENQPKNIYSTDTLLCKLDGTPNKNRLGANAVLATSIAYAKALAASQKLPLFAFLGGAQARLLPIPMMNILNGGAHADNTLDIQEFMIMPIGASSFSHAIQIGCETYQALKKLLKDKGFSTAIGDEGGFAPDLKRNEDALMLICDAIELAGYQPGIDVSIALDIAASEWYRNQTYYLPKQRITKDQSELFSYYNALCQAFPIVSIEDPFSDDDFEGFCKFTKAHGDIQTVGDDLFVTNPDRIRKGVAMNAANAVLIKPNQIGTLSETLTAIFLAQEASYNTVISHRSGDTDDSFIADLAVATNAGQIKTGAPCRGERIAKYNRLLEIEAMLQDNAIFGKFQ